MTTYDVSRATVRKAIDEPGRRRAAAPDPRQGHLRGPAPAGEPAAPGVVQPGHAPPRAHPVDPAARRRAGPAAGRGRRGARARAPTARPGGSTGSGSPTASRSRSRTAGTRRALAARPRHRTTSAARSTSSSPASTASPSTAPSRRCGARPPTGATARRLDAPSHTPLLVFRRVSARRRDDRWSTSSPATAATATRSTCPWAVTTSAPSTRTTEGNDAVSTADASTGATTQRDARGSTSRPLQKFGRSLMLPIAALPAAALLLRLGQPDLLGADGLGWDTRRRRHRRRRRRDLRQPAAAVRGRRRDRHGQEGRRLDRARRRRRLPRLQGRRRRDVAVRARRCRPRATTRS